tara:strand:- start:490 stop:1110 length:621 start_codon:yes stop_codon:yes gene_type:complete
MHNLDEFIQSQSYEAIRLPIKDSEIVYYPNFLHLKTATTYYNALLNETHWQKDTITIFGKTYPQPRLTCLHGIKGRTYTYSGIEMKPHPFSQIHLKLLAEIKKVTSTEFTSVLLNLYRDGNDSNGWHSDDEKELGKNPSIASISLGVKRFFHLKHKEDKNLTYKLSLDHGSLLLMMGPTQHRWKHQLPKSKKVKEARINLTFRRIY